jgi:hypothetical protein
MRLTNTIFTIILIIVIIIGFVIAIFPLIISFATGNWWFMFLYAVVPVMLFIWYAIIVGLITILEG